jgi:TetR/AcrR family transcriptional regulator, copper-responsive repressor
MKKPATPPSATPSAPPRRGRPRSFDRDVALDRALDLFCQRGYEGTSLAALTSAMEIAPPSLYAAFGSKENLFLEAVARYGATTGQFSVAALNDAPTAREATERLLVDAARAFTSEKARLGCPVVTAATNCAPESTAVEVAMRKQRIASEGAIRARIARGITEGELPETENAAELAKFYAAVFQGMSVQARDGASRADLERIARMALAVWPAKAASKSHR